MLYSEFVENTGCKETEYNYRVYKSLEALYMENDKLTKQDIYNTGKKLVDNSKSEEQIAFENAIKKRIEENRNDIEFYTERINTYSWYMSIATEEEKKAYKDEIKRFKGLIRKAQQEMKKSKWVLSMSS